MIFFNVDIFCENIHEKKANIYSSLRESGES